MYSTATWYVTSFYRFLPIKRENLDGLKARTKQFMSDHRMTGLVLFAEEGVNGTVAGETFEVDSFKKFICELVDEFDIRFKDSVSDVRPFHRMSVDIRSEIVGMKRTDLVPETTDDHHLSPKEWHEALANDKPKRVIDTRNNYETMLGKFKGAIDPDLKHFSDWGAYLESSAIPREEPIYIYCTGGIRCEKAILEMRSRGFEKVYQLRDGILGYIKEYPEGLFDGECFVFDDRVALDKDLQPSTRFGICPGCGLPSDTHKECERCGEKYYVCESCSASWDPVCSKTCRDQWRRHGRKAG